MSALLDFLLSLPQKEAPLVYQVTQAENKAVQYEGMDSTLEFAIREAKPQEVTA